MRKLNTTSFYFDGSIIRFGATHHYSRLAIGYMQQDGTFMMCPDVEIMEGGGARMSSEEIADLNELLIRGEQCPLLYLHTFE